MMNHSKHTRKQSKLRCMYILHCTYYFVTRAHEIVVSSSCLCTLIQTQKRTGNTLAIKIVGNILSYHLNTYMAIKFQIFSCLMWMSYGLLKDDATVMVVNFSGSFLQVVYIICYLMYTKEVVRVSIYLIMICTCSNPELYDPTDMCRPTVG